MRAATRARAPPCPLCNHPSVIHTYIGACMYLCEAAVVHRVPDRPSKPPPVSHPPSSPVRRALLLIPSQPRPPFRPRKLIKVQLIKITYFSSIGGARGVADGRMARGSARGERRSALPPRVRASLILFLLFFSLSLSLFFLFCYRPARRAARAPLLSSPLLLFSTFFCDAGRAGFLAI